MTNWKLLAVVTIGGGLGSVARFLATVLVQQRAALDFPAATFIINVTGSFLIGFLTQIGVDTAMLSPEARLFLTTGFCGGFTTFSTFSYETYRLIEDGEYRTAGLYVVSSVVLSLAGCAIGMATAHRLIAGRPARLGAD